MSEKLKPCPFCGHSAALESVGADHFVMCDGCCAETARFQSPTGDDRRAIEHAIAAWNKRAQHAGEARETVDLIGKLRAAYEKVSVYPEDRMRPDAVVELGPGFTDLLELRNLVPQAIAALAAAPQPAALPEGWQPITAPGQVSIGDKLKFTIGDKQYTETVKDVLDPGTDREEIIYNMRRNYYLITSMCMQNKGSQKNVSFRPAAPQPRE